MQFLKDLNTFHIDGKEIPCITAMGVPDCRYPGAPGVLYMDRDTGNLYICTDADKLQKTYFWRIVGDVDTTVVQKTVADYMAEHPVSGGRLSSTAVVLLINLLQNAVFTTNQTSNIAALRDALTSGGNSGGNAPDIPGEPSATDILDVTDGVMTIISVGSEITVSDGVMTIA